MPEQKSLLLLGSGPLIGVEVATLFAQNHFTHIALLSRSLTNLSRERATILSSVPSANVKVWSADTTDSAGVVATVQEVGEWLGGKLDVLVYNAARVHTSGFFGWDDEEIIRDFKTTTLTLHHVLEATLPLLQKSYSGHPSIFITSSRIAVTPSPAHVSLSVVKAAQRSLVLNMQQTFGDKIHIALVYVNGVVGRKGDGDGEDGLGNGFGGKLVDPKEIAGLYWELYGDGEGKWRGEVDFGTGF